MSCKCSEIANTQNKISVLEEELKLWEQDEKTLETMKKDIESCNISIGGIVVKFLFVASYSYVAYLPNNKDMLAEKQRSYVNTVKENMKELSENHEDKVKEVTNKIKEISDEIASLNVQLSNYQSEDADFHNKEDD